MTEAEQVAEMFRSGGPLMLLMVAASVVVMVVALERIWALFAFRRSLAWLEDRLLAVTHRGDLKEARHIAEQVRWPLRGVFVAGLDRALGQAKGDPGRAMQREHKRAMGELRSSVWILGTAGTMMPFIGLLGTVIGVMGSFQQIGATGASGFAVVSAGISQALIATAAGLAVALEAVFFYNYLQNGITALGREVALLVDEVLEHIQTAEADGAGTPDP